MAADMNSLDSGNNINWSFGSIAAISFYLDYPSGNSHITNTSPTYRWKKATVFGGAGLTKYELFVQPKDSFDNNTGTAL